MSEMTDGWYFAARHYTRWCVQDGHFNPPQIKSVHDTREAAQAEAHRLNHPPQPQHAAQASLFDTQEA